MAIPKLALIPSGVKAGKLYSVLPTNGDGDFTTTRNTVATRVNENGLIEEVAANVPRLDYSDGTCPSLLLEGTATNLVIYSKDFSQWTANGTPTITSNYGVSPNGTQNGTRIEFGADDRIRSDFSGSGDFTFSVYLKGSGVITLRDNTNVYLQNITLTSEWVRYDLSFNATITSVQIQNQTASVVDCEIWGAQLEQNSYSTSYIKTVGTVQSRSADTASGSGSSTVINSSEGVLYFEGSALANDGTNRTISFSDGTSANRVFIGYSSGDKITCSFQIASSAVYGFDFTTDINVNSKLALKYKENDFALWVNGVEVNSQLSGNTFSAGTFTQMQFASATTLSPFYGKTKSVQVYTTALSDAELTTLTTI